MTKAIALWPIATRTKTSRMLSAKEKLAATATSMNAKSIGENGGTRKADLRIQTSAARSIVFLRRDVLKEQFGKDQTRSDVWP